METVDKKIEKLKEIIDASENVVFFGGARCVDGKRNPGFQKRGWFVQPEI